VAKIEGGVAKKWKTVSKSANLLAKKKCIIRCCCILYATASAYAAANAMLLPVILDRGVCSP
jgi:type IV secretory pathway component VirB8